MNENEAGGAILTGENNCPSATLSTTNPTRTNMRLNPRLPVKRPASSRPGHGIVHSRIFRDRTACTSPEVWNRRLLFYDTGVLGYGAGEG
jgi:hypothetical protein